MKLQKEAPKKRQPILSKEIGVSIQKTTDIKGKVMVTQIRGGELELSVKASELQKLMEFVTKIPGYNEGIHLKMKSLDDKFYKITLASFFKLRLLGQLFLEGSERQQTLMVADLIDRITGIKAEHSEVVYFCELFKDFEWDSLLFEMFHEEAMLNGHVRKLVQAHTIACLQVNAQQFKPRFAIPLEFKAAATPVTEELNLFISVIPEDCLVAAKNLAKNGGSVAVLNMANQFQPGGGYGYGAGAQEEDLCRRTDLLKSLPGKYPNEKVGFGEFKVLYSKGVTVFRLGREKGYAVMPENEQFKINIISSAAYNIAKKSSRGYKNADSHDYQDGMKQKIRCQLRAAAQNGDRQLILSAFGCGAFGNDSKRVSQFYFDVMSEEEFAKAFDTIQFAIIPNPTQTDNSNYDNFQKTFAGKGVEELIVATEELIIK